MKFNIKHTAVMLFVLICMALYTGWYIQSDKGEDYNEGIIRFHVLANSDSAADQKLKLKVRDGVLKEVNKELIRETMQKYDSVEHPVETTVTPESVETASAQVSLDVDESREYLKSHLNRIEEIAKNIIVENGYHYDVNAELGVRWIPEKTYGDMTFPAGNYEALNITIGQGEGNNWWCVLFPPLCLIDGSDDPSQSKAFAPTTYAAIGMTENLMELRKNNKAAISTQTAIKLKFKTLELLEK